MIEEERLPEHFADANTTVAPSEIADEDVAYCIYTSGSTGRPKGGADRARQRRRLLPPLAEIMTVTAGSRCMNTSELYFDVHVMDLFFPLHRGATVHLSSRR